ncbi:MULTISPECIES: DUF418 domain-containing protein [unclassified Beijerinckia]|uniref:DUF418 domain-containing protein n=1 Tax=unclassified Beijerinckia TaxID=2638183 RepID=UPI00089D3ACC|nr:MULTISPECIES: DUF418 domain-containing protein [unclassified Beijerinckia]MDH7795146.1 uncharacterized protein [Beijerinckia sp. GAS462]SEB89502.1 uncharacterized protein SAMN05443249_1418 [Beijerinckia sp. 28-YEA-48]
MPAPLPDPRILNVDGLRGFALLGILVVNITAFGSPFYGLDIADPIFADPFDKAMRLFIALLFETKFYLLFSFLFGYSFTLQMAAAERVGESIAPRMLRRVAGLWLIGLIHAVFLFRGDILTTYAVLGVILLYLRDDNDGPLLKLAAGLIAATVLLWAAFAVLDVFAPVGDDPIRMFDQAYQIQSAYVGTAREVIGQNISAMSSMWIILALLQAPCALAMFLLGLVAGRRQMLVRPQQHEPLLRGLTKLGFLIGLPGAILYALSGAFLTGTPWVIAGLAIGLATAPFLTGAYIALGLRLFQTSFGARIRAALAPAGQMALTNYLLQSLVCALIFYGYGLKLIGQLSPFIVFVIGLEIFIVQLLLSRWWLARYAYGPVEWLLRAATLAAWPRWRKPSAARAAPSV